MTINSRSKGGRGEREARDVIRSHGFYAERGCQRAGGPDSPDIKSELTALHFEIKRTQNLRLLPGYDQATAQGEGKEPALVWRKNKRPWLAIISFDFLLSLLKLIQKSGMSVNDAIEWATKEGARVQASRGKKQKNEGQEQE